MSASCFKTEGSNMCCFCCTSLRGTVYYMVTVHMIGTFYMFIRCLYTFFEPPEGGYPDLDINPMIIDQIPLLLAGYALTACVFSCFMYRAVDMDSVIQMKWSAGCFAVFQFIVILNHFIFTVMFVDLLPKSWQALMVGLLVGNFLITITYLCILFLYGKKLHYNKFKRPKHVRNSFHNENESSNSTMENNVNAATAVLTLRKEPNSTLQSQNRMNVNLLENHVSVTSIGTETAPTPTPQSPVMATAATLPRSTQTSPRVGTQTTPRVGKNLPATILGGNANALSIPVPGISPTLIRPKASPPSPPHVTITVSSPSTPTPSTVSSPSTPTPPTVSSPSTPPSYSSPPTPSTVSTPVGTVPTPVGTVSTSVGPVSTPVGTVSTSVGPVSMLKTSEEIDIDELECASL